MNRLSIVSPRPQRRVALGAGCALIAAAAAAAPVAAQTTLAPIVVTATREPIALDRVASDLVVIDADRIRQSTADSLEDLLRREAGVQLSRNGGPGQNANVFIRGASSSNTVLLVDGVRVGSATLGQADLSSIALAQIDRIEVLRGPGSSLYGADAVGGVIQVFTRRGEGAPRFAAHAAVGGEASSELDGAISGSSASVDYAATLSTERSDGVSALRPNDRFGNFNPDRDGFRRDSASLRASWTPAAGHRVGVNLVATQVNAQYDGSEFLPPSFAKDASPDFRNRLRNTIASLDYQGALTPAWTTRVQASRQQDRLRSGGTVIDRFLTRRDQFTWQNAWAPVAGQRLVLAYEHQREAAESTSFDADASRDNNALVLGYAGQFGAHALQADLRHDDNSAYGANTTGRLGWSVELAPGLRLRALAGTTFRAPSFNDLVFPGYGVPTLRPERGRSVEVGLNWRDDRSEAGVTVYRNRVRDLIGYESHRSFCPPDAAFDFGCARNTGRARLQGATLTAAHRAGALQLRATLDFLDATDAATGTRLARRAAHQESVSADYDAGAWTLGAALLSVGQRPDGGKSLDAYATLDLRATWRVAPQWRIEAKLLNATDQDIEPARDYQSPGRQAWVGVRYDGAGL